MGAPRLGGTRRREDLLVWVAAATLLTATAARWVRREIAPRLAIGLGWSAGAGLLAAAWLGRRVDLLHTAAGIRVDRTRAALGDLAAVALLVHLPRRWPRWRPRLVRAGGAAGGMMLLVAAILAASGPGLELAASTVDERALLADLEQRSTIIAADGSALAILHGGIDRRVVPLDRIPAHVRHAVLAAEDRRFYEHPGYDLAAMARAARANLRAAGVVQGGSTITQQLAKQNLVGDDRTFRRKLAELVHAVALERERSKDELLERYLNQVYFGSGAYGVAAAAEQFFAQPVEALTPGEAALLAGLIRAPGSFDPRAELDRARARRDAVLAAMAAEGFLDPGTAAATAAEPLELFPRRADTVPLREPHAVEAVKRELLTLPELGATRAERAEAVLTGGLRIEVTIDPALQEVAAAAVREALRDPAGPTSAVAAVEPGSGRIRALHTGADFAVEQFDVASQARRQPGSAFKPFVAVAALEAGLPATTLLDGDGPMVLHGADGGEDWTVGNFDRRSHGPVDLRQALAHSVNTAFAELVMEVGVDAVVDVASRLGIDPDRAFGPPETRGPSIALGGLTHGVAPVDLAGAYAALLDGGGFNPPYLVERVTGPDGAERYRRQPDTVQAVAPDVAVTTHDLLRDVVRRGTGVAAQIGELDVAGKTGTTQGSADAWFVGGTEGLTTAVWVGHPDASTPMPGVTGGTAAARIWRAFTVGALEQ